MRQKEASAVENSAAPDRRSSSSKHYNQRKSAISSAIKFYPEAGALFLRETVQFKKSFGLELIKALSLVLSDRQCSLMVQCIELGKNCGIEDEEVIMLAQNLVTLSNKGNLKTLKHLSLSSIGAGASSICGFIKALPQIALLKSLDLSNNALPFFCIDQLINSLKVLEDASQSRKPSRISMPDEENSDSYLIKLNLSGTKLDELSAFQLLQGVLQHSFIQSLDLSNNVQLGHNFVKSLEQLLNLLRFKFTLKKINLVHTGVSSSAMIRISKLIEKNRASTAEEAVVNRLYFPNKQQVPVPSAYSTLCRPQTEKSFDNSKKSSGHL